MDTTTKLPIEQFILQSLIDDIDSSSQTEQDDISLPLFTFNNNDNTVDSYSHVHLNKTDNSTNSSSSSDDSTPHTPLSLPSLTLQNILNALTSQKVSIYLQKIVREMKSSELDLLLNELKGNFFSLMIDKNGNYLCSDIFKLCNPFQRQVIIKEIFNYIDDIAIHEYGTHSIQTLIEFASTKEESFLLCSSLCNDFKMSKVALHPRGAYVIQKMIQRFPETIRDNNFNYYLMKIIHLLSIDIFGVCTVKQFALFTKNELTIVQILRIIYKHFFIISKNKFGNYLIQFILKLWWNKCEMFAFKLLIEKSFYELSIDEFSSHIVETYVKLLTIEHKQRLYNDLIQNGTLVSLMNNKFGVYVVNKLVGRFNK